ncbi:gluconokinase [Sinorhizobium garamanticum]|uniref:Gluconokinase n=1 Tax=Sinorhizobium garamanticum TaxID=680247 RepID=A0ABY8DHV9_9HYPH|nr:gluconokinase [Sinorhizobium garamanticum]WEX90485.1 gluconokinase [Sinorhizobium garamanticum]
MAEQIRGIVVMGVSGCGKSSVGAAIAALYQGRLIEGDAFHPAANIAKMGAGVPLTDEDRHGWLCRLSEEVASVIAAGERPVLTCSALRKSYRDLLRQGEPRLGFVFLDLDRDLAAERVATRPGHFMPASLIESQYQTLEPPYQEPLTLAVDASLPVEALAEQAVQWWQETDGTDPA